MLTLTAQFQAADVIVHMARACAVAGTRAWTASMLQGLSLWSGLLQGSGGDGGSTPGRGAVDGQEPYSSYRSGGGHAVAQVIMGRFPAGGRERS